MLTVFLSAVQYFLRGIILSWILFCGWEMRVHAQAPSEWQYDTTGMYHIIFIPTENVFANNLRLQQGDYIGMFYTSDNNVKQCAGAVAYDPNAPFLEMTANGRRLIRLPGDSIQILDGFEEGEVFDIRIWDASEGYELTDLTVSYEEPSGGLVTHENEFIDGGISRLQELRLTCGEISYPQSEYCLTEEEEAILPRTNPHINSTITYTANSLNIALDPTTGAIDPINSLAGNYTIYFTAQPAQCLREDSVTITLYRPLVTIEGTRWICDRDSTILQVSESFAAYEWSTGDTTRQIVVYESGEYNVTISDSIGCQVSDTITVTFFDSDISAPVTDLGPDTVACQPVILDAGSQADFYLWSTGENTQTIEVRHPGGTFWVEVRNDAGCIARDTVEVTVNTDLEVDLGRDLEICGYSVRLSPSITGGFGDLSYQWNDTDTTETAFFSQSGTYTLFVSDTTGCTASDSVRIDIHNPPEIDLSDSLVTCSDTLVITGPVGFERYLWGSGETTESITAEESGFYYLTVFDEIGCASTDSVLILLGSEIISENIILRINPQKCVQAGSIIIDTTSILGGTAPYNFALDTEGLYQESPVFEDLTEGDYRLLIRDRRDCEASLNFNVPREELSLNDLQYEIRQAECDRPGSLILQTDFITGLVEPYTFILIGELEDSLVNTTGVFDELWPAVYELWVRDGIGCTVKYEFPLEVDGNNAECDDILTPDGDGQNDVFCLTCSDISVYDRWGVRIRRLRNITCWDGRDEQNRIVPSGAYILLCHTDRQIKQITVLY